MCIGQRAGYWARQWRSQEQRSHEGQHSPHEALRPPGAALALHYTGVVMLVMHCHIFSWKNN
jgi:hypothetical protein